MAHNFSTGDNVEVIEGELINLQGKILAVDGSKITMQPKHEDLKEPLEFQANELRKSFKQGDHVKVRKIIFVYYRGGVHKQVKGGSPKKLN